MSSVKNIKKEVIVVNDGSSDNSYKVIKNECKNLFNKLVSYKKNKGKGFACRLGIKRAKEI